MADDLRSRIETLIASTPYVIGKDCYMVKVSDLEDAIAAVGDGLPSDPTTLHRALEAVGRKMGTAAAASVPSPPAQEKEMKCRHPKRARRAGRRVPAVWGSWPTQVCMICGSKRIGGHLWGSWKKGQTNGR